jgi:hypothetical protein
MVKHRSGVRLLIQKRMPDKITYGREEGGFAVYVNGQVQGIWRVKGWMNGLRKYQGQSFSSHAPKSSFYKTQFEYHGKYE